MTFDLGVHFLAKEPRHHAYYGRAHEPICVIPIASGISILNVNALHVTPILKFFFHQLIKGISTLKVYYNTQVQSLKYNCWNCIEERHFPLLLQLSLVNTHHPPSLLLI